MILVGVLALAAVVFGLGRLAIINSERRDAEKKRGDTLQQSVDALRSRADEEQKFLEIIRQLLIAKSAEERQALVDQLRGFQFTTPTTSATSTTRTSSVTTTTQTPRSTTTTRPPGPPTTRPPSTTSTTHPPPPPTIACVSVPTRSPICT